MISSWKGKKGSEGRGLLIYGVTVQPELHKIHVQHSCTHRCIPISEPTSTHTLKKFISHIASSWPWVPAGAPSQTRIHQQTHTHTHQAADSSHMLRRTRKQRECLDVDIRLDANRKPELLWIYFAWISSWTFCCYFINDLTQNLQHICLHIFVVLLKWHITVGLTFLDLVWRSKSKTNGPSLISVFMFEYPTT